MIVTEILGLVRYILDPSTRRDIRSIARASGYGKLRWRKLIRSTRAKFSGDHAYEVPAFAHSLDEELRAVQIDQEIVERFHVVFAELVDNAFRHGCVDSPKHTVRIRCDYGPWFIRLQVTDSGGGFHLDPDITPDGRAHGVDIAARLSHSLKANRKGNSVVAIVLPRRELAVAPLVENVNDAEILVLTISNSAEWHYLISDWEPLRRALAAATQRLVLINSFYMRWSSQEFSIAMPKILPFLEQPDRYFAFVVDLNILGAFDIRALQRTNSRVFGRLELEDAKSWLAGRVPRAAASI